MTLEEAKKRAMDDAKQAAEAIVALKASAKKAETLPVEEAAAAEDTPLLLSTTEGTSPGMSSSSSLRRQGFSQKSMSSVSFAQETSVRMIGSESEEIYYETSSTRSASSWFRRMYNRSKSALEWTTSLRDHAVAHE
eukprot:scaffold36968_cov43-Attheya_sp.AAC.1